MKRLAMMAISILATLGSVVTTDGETAARPSPVPAVEAPEAKAKKKVVTQVIPGTIKGRQASLPYKIGWADNPDYGRPANAGVWVENIVTIAELAEAAAHHNVPWATTDKATDRHNVYQIWGIRPNQKLVLYKYGITKEPSGTYRPSSQIGKCEDYMRELTGSAPQCDWAWLRTNTSNFMRARRVEAAYFIEYKIRNGKCPPGALSCK